MFFLFAKLKKVFLKYLVVSWIPLSSLHIVLLRTLLGGLFLLGLFFLWGVDLLFIERKNPLDFWHCSAVLFSVLFLGETMLPLQIIGAVLMIGGAMVCEVVKKKKPA